MTQILLGVFKECLGIGLKSAFAREFEIGSNVGDNGTGIVQTLVNASEKKVYITISLRGVEAYIRNLDQRRSSSRVAFTRLVSRGTGKVQRRNEIGRLGR